MAAVDASQTTMNRTGATVAILLVLTLAAGIGCLVKLDLPQNNHDILLVLITAVATNVTNIVQFFFGSSSTAKAKDDTINTLSTTAATVATNAMPQKEKPDVTLPPGASVTVDAEKPKEEKTK